MYFRFVLTTNNIIDFILFLCALEAFLLQNSLCGVSLPFTRQRRCPALPDRQKWKFNKGAKDNFESSQQDFLMKKDFTDILI